MAQVDRSEGLVGNTAFKAPVRVATTANITLNGEQTIDGVVCVANDRILVKNQNNSVDNGIWVVSTGAWSRAKDFDGAYDVAEGSMALVTNGSTNSNSVWRILTSSPVIGSALSWMRGFFADSSLINFLQSGAGAVATIVQSKLRESVSVKDFGAVGDGVADDTTALNNAFALVGRRVLQPKGTYKITANLAQPLCTMIVGEGFALSIIKSVGATKVLTLGTAANKLFGLQDFQILGDATPNAIGISFGDSSQLINNLVVNNVTVDGFTGTGAIGASFDFIVQSQFINFCAGGNTVNMQFKGSVSGADPVQNNFFGGLSQGGLVRGIVYATGIENVFYGTAIQSAAQEGFYMAPAAGVNASVIFEDVHFENNYGNNITNFQMIVDGSAGGGSAVVRIMRGKFTGSAGSSAKAANFTGAACIYQLDQVMVTNTAGMFKISNNAFGYINLPVENADNFPTIVEDTTHVCSDITQGGDTWRSWTPTVSSNLGNQAATFSSYTLDNATYRRRGKDLHLAIYWHGTTVAGTPAYIDLTLPNAFTAGGVLQQTPCVISNQGIQETGYIYTASSINTKIRFYRANAAVFGSVSAIAGGINITLQLSAVS